MALNKQELTDYWGDVQADWAGFSAGKTFFTPLFKKEMSVFLGKEFDEDGEETETPPTSIPLTDCAETFQHFLAGANEIIDAGVYASL